MFTFPFTSFERINLDWIMRTLNQLKAAIPLVSQAQEVYEQALEITHDVPAQITAIAATADSAVTTAQGAETTAQSAVTTAQGAVTTAQGAVTTAQGAVTTANSAYDRATQAGLDATAATGTAQAAQTSAGNAITIAAQAQSAAEDAAEDAYRTLLKVGYELIASSGPDSSFPSSPGALLDSTRYVTFLINAYTTYNSGNNTFGSLLIHAGTLSDMLNRSNVFRHYFESTSGTTNAITLEITFNTTEQGWYVSPPASGVHYQIYGQAL